MLCLLGMQCKERQLLPSIRPVRGKSKKGAPLIRFPFLNFSSALGSQKWTSTTTCIGSPAELLGDEGTGKPITNCPNLHAWFRDVVWSLTIIALIVIRDAFID
jgi:hypothetical protein